MRTFCAILLLGVVTYVQAADDCADYAVNVAESKTPRQGEDANNPALPLNTFLQRETSTFYTAMATGYTSSPNACTAPTHGSNCGGVEYSRKFVDDHKNFDENLLFKAIQFDTTFIGYNKAQKTAIEYKMRIGGKSKDDYILQHVEGTEIKAFKINDLKDPKNSRVQINNADIDAGVLTAIKSEFALYSYKPGGYNIYLTCDLKSAWVTYGRGVNFNPRDMNLEEDIKNLKNLAAQKGKTLEVMIIDREFPEELSAYIDGVYSGGT